MEHIVTSNIMTHNKLHSILYRFQHGFRSLRSCETQLLEFSTDVTNNMHNGKQTNILIMDFIKAFDKVGHECLLAKLALYGITGKTNNWIRSFLSNRKQTVVLEDERSYCGNVTSGIAQGSVLGPCLFLMYINDMPDQLRSTVRLFADATTAYLAIESTDDVQTLQHYLNLLAAWEHKWQMEFHLGKCQVLRVTRNRTRKIESNYVLHGHTLEVVDVAKYLGVTITSDLNWNQHIANIKNKATSTLSFLQRNVRANAPKLKEKAYQAIVHPHLEYCCTVWDPNTKANIKKLKMVQRRAARYTLNQFQNTSSVDEMLTHLNWTSLETRRQHARLTMMYKMTNGLAAVQYQQYITQVERASCHTGSHCFQTLHSHTDYHHNSNIPRTVREWNNLLPDIAQAPSLSSFRGRLSHL